MNKQLEENMQISISSLLRSIKLSLELKSINATIECIEKDGNTKLWRFVDEPIEKEVEEKEVEEDVSK